MLFASIKDYIEEITGTFDFIPAQRKEVLLKLSQFISGKLKEGKKAEVIYICTHNSRRSHFGQIWAQVAAYYYGFTNVKAYSGGTQATAFHPNVIKAIEKAGFKVNSNGETPNPHYSVLFNTENDEIICFSKIYDDVYNPATGFCAVMTCAEAEANCPLVAGAAVRMATTYEDPKAFDNTAKQDEMYEARCSQIARETLYAFSLAGFSK